MEQDLVRLKQANITDIGRNPARTVNEDYLGQYEGEFGNLFLVCDGMGGHEAGEVASKLAVESIKQYFETNYLVGDELNTIALSIDFAQQKITEQVRQNPELASMGTTLVLLLIKGANFWYAHSGDSRLYLSRGGSLNQLTKDHSEVQMMVESGIITQEQAAEHPRRNFITKAIGHTSYLPEISGPCNLQQDDVFLLCTDGLTEHVNDEELLHLLDEEPQITCRTLVEMANERGGSDNITLQIVRVMQVSRFTMNQETPVPKKSKALPYLGIIATILVFLGAVLWFVLGNQQDKLDRPAKPEKAKTEKKADKKKTEAGKPADLDALERSMDDKLGAYNSGYGFEKVKSTLDLFKGKDNQALKLKFINNPQGNQVVYILPGRCIYLAYEKLALGKDAILPDAENIYALLAIAVAKKTTGAGLTTANWEQKFYATDGKAVDDQLYRNARDLCAKLKPEDISYAQVMFNSDNRFGKVRPRIKVSAYNISLD